MSASRTFTPEVGSVQKGVVHLYGFHTTTTSGTLSTTATAFTPAKQAGYTLTKTASETGRYTVQLTKTDGTAATYNQLLDVSAIIEGAADTAYTAAKGLVPMLRGVAVATTGIFYLQFVNDLTTTGTFADAEVEDGAIIRLHIVLKNSGV